MTRDLFGFDVDEEPARGGSVELALVLHDQRPKAWLLSETGREIDAEWVPKSQVSRGPDIGCGGRDENVWTVPVWLARDRGWI